MKVETSSNVIAEDLHNTKSLETAYYLQDMLQSFDTRWERESGLQVNIGAYDIQLIPQYEDVDHDSDNSYMLDQKNLSEDKPKFAKIIQNHCRWECKIDVYIFIDLYLSI